MTGWEGTSDGFAHVAGFLKIRRVCGYWVIFKLKGSGSWRWERGLYGTPEKAMRRAEQIYLTRVVLREAKADKQHA